MMIIKLILITTGRSCPLPPLPSLVEYRYVVLASLNFSEGGSSYPLPPGIPSTCIFQPEIYCWKMEGSPDCGLWTFTFTPLSLNEVTSQLKSLPYHQQCAIIEEINILFFARLKHNWCRRCRQGCTTCCILASGLRENGERMRK